MDGLHEAVGAPKPVSIGGKTYWLSPMKAKHWGEAAQVLIQRRKSPLEILRELLPSLDDVAAKHLVELAYRDERDGELMPTADIQRWFRDTEEGYAFRFWCMIRQRHPEVTFDDAENLIAVYNEELKIKYEAAKAKAAAEMQRTMEDGEGMPQGNSSGLDQTGETKASQDHSPGENASESCPPSTT